MQTYLNQQEVVFGKTTNINQDPTGNQHQHIIFIIIHGRNFVVKCRGGSLV